MVSYDRVVCQKDLGPDSIDIVKKMELYNPDESWHFTYDEESSGIVSSLISVPQAERVEI